MGEAADAVATAGDAADRVSQNRRPKAIINAATTLRMDMEHPVRETGYVGSRRALGQAD
jgi:hypothetical protein